MRRREFITLLGAAAAWPLAARAQQTAMPVVGMLGSGSIGQLTEITSTVRKVLIEFGYVEGQNLAFEHRFADGVYERLPELAAELVRRPVAAIVATPFAAALAAKAATKIVPIVFAS